MVQETMAEVTEENKYSSIFLLVLFVAGFTSMAYEVVAIREMAIILGPTEIASALVLAAFMGGLALGSYYIGNLGEKFDPIKLLFWIQVAISFLGFILLPLIRTIKLIKSITIAFPIFFLILMIPAFFMGGEIPLVSKILTRNQQTSKWVGKAYSTDTFGGIFGSLATGILLLPILGAYQVFIFASVLVLLSAVLILVRKKLIK